MSTVIRGKQIKDNSVTGDDVDESTLIIQSIKDTDNDTKIQCEESADEDKIRFDTAGTERLVINADGGMAFGNGSAAGAAGAWNYFNFKGGGVRVTANNFYCDNDRGVLWGDSSVSVKGNATAGSESLTVRANYNAYIHVDGVNDAVGIGTTSPSSLLEVHSDSTGEGTLLISQNANDGDASQLDISKGRGTKASPTAVNANDFLGHIRFLGYDGDSYDNFADIYVQTTGTVNTTSHPGNIVFRTCAESSTSLSTRMVIAPDGNVGIGASSPKTILDTHHNPTTLSNDTGGGEVVTFGTGNLTAGKIYFLNSSGAWTETDADAIPTSDGLLAVALGSSPSNGMLLRGFFDATTYLSNFISGLPVYLSATAAAMDTTQPTGTGKIVRCVGYCTNTANVIYFNPSSTTIELS
jgi:hypothetical protein